MTTQPHPARRSLLRLFLGSGVLLLAACQADSTEAPRPDTTGTPATATPSASPPTRTATDAGLTAEQRLTLLADTLSSTPADTTTDLPYVYLHLQTWTRATNTIIRTDIRRWRHADGSGREVTRRAPDLKGVDHQPRPDELPLFDHATPTTHRHPPGSLHPYLPNRSRPTRHISPSFWHQPNWPASPPTRGCSQAVSSAWPPANTSTAFCGRRHYVYSRGSPASPTPARRPTSPDAPAWRSTSPPTGPPPC